MIAGAEYFYPAPAPIGVGADICTKPEMYKMSGFGNPGPTHCGSYTMESSLTWNIHCGVDSEKVNIRYTKVSLKMLISQHKSSWTKK